MNIKNKPAIAVVLKDEDVFTVSKETLSGADLIELRVDMFKEVDKVIDIFVLAEKKYELPLLCTIRLPQEGGKKEIKNRLKIYEAVMPYCSFFDIEIFSDEAFYLRKLTEETNINLIGSYHNFTHTPSLEEVEKIFDKGKTLDIDIIKIATMVNEQKDLETLLCFTIKHKNDNVIVLGMGQKGIPSRIINPVFGSLITYASLNEASAPGQIPLKELVNIFKVLGLRN